ncbi:MAG: type II CAAX endopeptidase family protein [Candidatus Omnitrophota bacterium]
MRINTFFKKNWLYVILFCFILSAIFLPRLGHDKGTSEELDQVGATREEEEINLFVGFEEAKERTQKIDKMLKKNLPLYLFYIAMNMLILLVFLAGLAIGGYFIYALIKKKEIIRKTHFARPPPWEIGDIFRIIILSLALTYVFFIAFGFITKFLEPALGTGLTFFKNDNFRMTFDTIVLDLIVLFIILRFMRKIYRRELSAFGFVKKDIARNIMYGVCGYIVVLPVIFIIGVVVYIILNIFNIEPPPQPIVGLFLAEKSVALIALSGIVAAVLGPVIEEIFFRGVMYNAVKRKLGIFWAVLLTSVLFSFLHTHAMSFFLVGFIPIAILGIVLAYLYEKTGSLVPSITLHVLNNAASVLMVFMFKYFNSLI